jgi:hypothetical protein
MEVYGETGSAVTVRRDEIRVRRGRGNEELVTAKPLPTPHDDPVTFLRAVVRREVKPDGLSSLVTNLTVTEILDAARRSAMSGKTVTLPAMRGVGK